MITPTSTRCSWPNRLLSRFAAPLLVFGCASANTAVLQTSSPGPEERFEMTGAGFQTAALINKAGAQGPQIDVGRYDDGKTIRGQASGGVIDLTVTDTDAHGIWGRGPINLKVIKEGNQLKLSGLIAGRPSSWTASTEAVQGTIGLCSYDLRRDGDSYSGSRSCAGGITTVNVKFPSTILEWRPINIGVLMALLMST